MYDRVAEYVRAAPPELKPYAIGAVKVIIPRPSTSSSSELHKYSGAIIGMCVALFVVALVVVVAVVMYIFWQRKRCTTDQEESTYSLLNSN